ncbi:LPS export ABC transporter periplasmic protein LptC [Legionella impletisoli]|uniref:LPS export ABC transporter periplasmic protein LptC n=1 Tax=Legionella impletisoli TaxID=343510 RepID=A0A917JQD0_9GAMM|nr:LPS export ABC transporter periplasmic protein LptC [Legionella impletisoli]GGI81035.1 LPS export ABC transporter periplasmic protein LptC [Legionella impletisoli]
MNAGKQAAWLFAVLIGLAFSSWYFASSAPVKKLDENTLSNTVDTIIQDLTLSQYNEEGKRINFLKTPLMHHIPKDNKHWLKTPYIVVTQENQTPWEIKALEATSLYGGDKITLSKHVVLHQASSEKTPESTLKTEEIIYFPKKKLATTKKSVTFEQPGNIVQSEGMKAYLAEKRVKLLGNARGKYEPKHG